MRSLMSMGELLVDFISCEKGCSLSKVKTFQKEAGGAPANVAAAFAKLGGKAYFLGKVGDDEFGRFLHEKLTSANVDTQYLFHTETAKTALAFVSLKEDGDRDFDFYRNPSADMLLSPEELQADWFQNIGALHFCSVDLVECPTKYAHIKAVEYAKAQGAYISFDPNLRFPLWRDESELKKTVKQFLPYADIIKVSDEEIEFICDTKNIKKAADLLLKTAKLVVITKGAGGAEMFTKNESSVFNGFSVNAVDTTGAGDCFCGALLFAVLSNNLSLCRIKKEDMDKLLLFSCAASAISVTRKGGIASMPKLSEVENIIKETC